MPELPYLFACAAAAGLVTFLLRVAPFIMKARLEHSGLLTALGRWMPVGAISILAMYCLTLVDFDAPAKGVPELAGIVVTVGVHRWKRNAVLSMVLGTAACVLLANTVSFAP